MKATAEGLVPGASVSNGPPIYLSRSFLQYIMSLIMYMAIDLIHHSFLALVSLAYWCHWPYITQNFMRTFYRDKGSRI